MLKEFIDRIADRFRVRNAEIAENPSHPLLQFAPDDRAREFIQIVPVFERTRGGADVPRNPQPFADQTGADAASKLGNTPSGAGGSVLDQLTGQGGGGAPGQQQAA